MNMDLQNNQILVYIALALLCKLPYSCFSQNPELV